MAKRYLKKIRQKARSLRSLGWSLGEISQKMAIPKNTISGWVKDIHLTKIQRKRIKQKEVDSAAIGRDLAVKLLSKKMGEWKEGIKEKVKYLEQWPLKNPEIRKIICGLLYLCEGAKYPSTRYLQFVNSNPQIINFFINSLRKYFHIREDKLRISIGYRYDQNLQKLIYFWSGLTKIPEAQFHNSKPDIRTKGEKTFKKDYMGVCKIIYCDTSLQYELQAIGEAIIKNGAGED